MTASYPSRREVLQGVGAGAVLLTAGASVSSADGHMGQQGNGRAAKVRVGHLSPDAPNVDVYVDGNKVVSDLAYSNFDPEGLSGKYYELPPGEYDITTKIAGTDTTIGPLSVSGFAVEANTNYTVLATGELNPEGPGGPGLGLLPLVDNGDDAPAVPPADAALVRLVHASPDADEVELIIRRNGSTVDIIRGVNFQDTTGYLELPPGDYTVDVDWGAIRIPLSLEAGTKVSGYVIGNVTTAGEDDAEIGATLSLEAVNPEATNGRGNGEDDH
jgi:hypothetical protein